MQKLQISPRIGAQQPQDGRGRPSSVLAPLPSTDAVRGFQTASRAPATRAAYESDWSAFTTWCTQQRVAPLPAEPMTVAVYLAAAADHTDANGNWVYAPATLGRWLSSINKAHSVAGHPKPGAHPDVELTLAGIRRTRKRPVRRMSPLLLEDLRTVLRVIDLDTWPGAVRGHRDTALLLLGFAGAFRRSELAGLTAGDVAAHPSDGLHIRVTSSKTDQEGRGSIKAVPFGANPLTCAPCAATRWTSLLSVDARVDTMRALTGEQFTQRGHVCRDGLAHLAPETPLFPALNKSGARRLRAISGQTVNDIVKTRVSAAGMDASSFGGHSLRAGFVTQALRAGASTHEIMRQTHHLGPAMIDVYSRENDPLRHNAVAKIGL